MMRTVVAALLAATLLQSGVRSGKTSTGIAYDVRGSGPVIVLLTGSNLDRRMWDREAGWLSITHTVVRYDLSALGESDTVTFDAPAEPGAYPYLCSFPGHFALMQGVLTVKAK